MPPPGQAFAYGPNGERVLVRANPRVHGIAQASDSRTPYQQAGYVPPQVQPLTSPPAIPELFPTPKKKKTKNPAKNTVFSQTTPYTTNAQTAGAGADTVAAPNYVSEAARLLGQATAGNPFAANAQSTLAGGGVPGVNTFQPAFFRYTQPSIANAMLGLWQSSGMPLDDSRFMINQWRPPSYR